MFLHTSLIPPKDELLLAGIWPPMGLDGSPPLAPRHLSQKELLGRFDAFSGFAREGARPVPVLRPLLPLPGPEDDLPLIERWLTTFESLDQDSRAGLYQFLERPFCHMIHAMANGDDDRHLLGILAITLISRQGLYKTVGPGFPTPLAFIKAYMRAWGLASSATRVSRLINGGTFWLELRSAKLPLPARISTLEGLLPRKNRHDIYRKLVMKAGGKAPTAAQILDYLVAHGIVANNDPALPAWTIAKGTQTVEALLRAEPLTSRLEEALRQLVRIREAATPRFKNRRGRARNEAAIYDVTLGCPVRLVRQGAAVQVFIRPGLPEAQQAAAWNRAHENGWTTQPTPNGGGSHWNVPLAADNADQAHAESFELVEFFGKLCRRVGAPEPELETAAA